jgi:hypothetical protein
VDAIGEIFVYISLEAFTHPLRRLAFFFDYTYRLEFTGRISVNSTYVYTQNMKNHYVYQLTSLKGLEPTIRRIISGRWWFWPTPFSLSREVRSNDPASERRAVRADDPDGSKLASVSSDGSLLELFSLSTHWSYAVEGTDGQRLASIEHVRAEGDPAEQALSEVAVAIETGTVLPGGAAGRRLRNPSSARAVRKVAEPGSARRMPTFGFERVGYSR